MRSKKSPQPYPNRVYEFSQLSEEERENLKRATRCLVARMGEINTSIWNEFSNNFRDVSVLIEEYKDEYRIPEIERYKQVFGKEVWRKLLLEAFRLNK